MKILHTADWHLGQLFQENDRSNEQAHFLNWLVDTIREQQIALLLVSGDVFDHTNPPAAAVKLFYSFLNRAVKASPGIQIIIIAGNHDSPARLETPRPLLEASGIHIIGTVGKTPEGNPDYEKLVIPVKDKSGATALWCLAIPYLRLGDYPVIQGSPQPYIDGVAALYQDAWTYTLQKKQPDQAIIAMGHLHTSGTVLSEQDRSERLIMGGVEGLPISVFPEGLAYVALGHIHKAQAVGGKEWIRYSGSPLPMSFSEKKYRHQVVVFELEEGEIKNLDFPKVPVYIKFLSIPETPRPLETVLTTLQQLVVDTTVPPAYLEVKVLLDKPEPALRHQIETVLEGKNIRLAKISIHYPGAGTAEKLSPVMENRLQELTPVDVFTRFYQERYKQEPAQELIQYFIRMAAGASEKEVGS